MRKVGLLLKHRISAHRPKLEFCLSHRLLKPARLSTCPQYVAMQLCNMFNAENFLIYQEWRRRTC